MSYPKILHTPTRAHMHTCSLSHTLPSYTSLQHSPRPMVVKQYVGYEKGPLNGLCYSVRVYVIGWAQYNLDGI